MVHLTLLLLLSIVGTFVCDGKLRAQSVRLGATPGVALRLRRSAINGFFKNAMQLASKYANKIPIPDVAVTVSGIDIETKNVRVSYFPPPEMTYKLVAPNQILGKLKVSAVGIQGPFNATRHLLAGSSQKASGTVIFNATNAVIKFQAVLGKFDNGVPNLASFKCESNLGPANLQVRDVKEQFAIDIMSVAAKAFRPVFNTQVCSVAEKLITGQVNRLMSKIPNVVDINAKVSIKFLLKPVISDDYIELQGFAKVITDTVSPTIPTPFQEAYNNDTMVVLFVSDAIINDLLYQAYVNKLIDFTIHKNSHPALYELISLKCEPNHVACLGNVSPNLAMKFGQDADVETVFKTIKQPVLTITKGKAYFSIAMSGDLYLTPTNGTTKYHDCNVVVDVTGSLLVKIKDGVAYGKANVENVTVNIDENHNKKWEEKIGNTIHRIVEEYINGDFLFKGLPLRLPFGIGLEEPTVSFLSHTLQIQSGFNYNAQTSGEDMKRKGKN